MTTPMVSVLMKVYNGQRYLREAIDSVLQQTYSNFELLIIDDGSTDASVSIIKEYTDERIRFFQNEYNMGLCATQNKIIGEAKGKYLAVMDCDDISYPTRLEKQVAFLEEHPEIMMCGTQRNNIVEGKTYPFGELENWSAETIKFGLLFGNHFFTHSSIMFRHSEYKESGLSYGPIAIAEDYQVIVEMAKRYSLAVLPERLVGYRIDPASISHVKNKEITQAAGKIKSDYLQSLPIDEGVKEILREYLATDIAKAPMSEFLAAVHKVADTMGADISREGNAFPVACHAVKEYLLRMTSLSMKTWRQIRHSDYRDLVRLNRFFGCKTFLMCLLCYKRQVN